MFSNKLEFNKHYVDLIIALGSEFVYVTDDNNNKNNQNLKDDDDCLKNRGNISLKCGEVLVTPALSLLFAEIIELDED